MVSVLRDIISLTAPVMKFHWQQSLICFENNNLLRDFNNRAGIFGRRNVF